MKSSPRQTVDARSGDSVAIAGYLGSSGTFDQAVTEFAEG